MSEVNEPKMDYIIPVDKEVPTEVLDLIINKLLKSKNSSSTKKFCLSWEEILALFMLAKKKFMSEPMLLKLKSPIMLCGDVHGQFEDLLGLFSMTGKPPDNSYLFLGDYVDRGKKSLETICILLAYSCKYPDKFWVLRGNHEDVSMSHYGFKAECERRATDTVMLAIKDLFEWMPVAATIDGSVFCCHGGASQHLQSLADIEQLPRPAHLVTRSGLLIDLLWADPDNKLSSYGPSTRGLSQNFGRAGLNQFLRKTGCSLMVRAHQLKAEGYEFHRTVSGCPMRVVTMFSAPNYCSGRNSAAVMNLIQGVPRIKFNFFILTKCGWHPIHKSTAVYNVLPFGAEGGNTLGKTEPPTTEERIERKCTRLVRYLRIFVRFFRWQSNRAN